MAAGDGVPPRRPAAVSREAWVGDGWSRDGAEAEVGAGGIEDEMGTTRRRRRESWAPRWAKPQPTRKKTLKQSNGREPSQTPSTLTELKFLLEEFQAANAHTPLDSKRGHQAQKPRTPVPRLRKQASNLAMAKL